MSTLFEGGGGGACEGVCFVLNVDNYGRLPNYLLLKVLFNTPFI